MNLDNIQLYGIAIAAIPKGKNQLAITCTPIAVSKPKGYERDFQPIPRLQYNSIINLDDKQAVKSCFMKLTSILGEVVKLQEGSCNQALVPYRPVALCVGQAEANPVDLGPIVRILFEQLMEERPIKEEKINPEEAAYARHCRNFAQLLTKCTWEIGDYRIEVDNIPPLPHVNGTKQYSTEKELIKLRKKIIGGKDKDGAAHRRIIEIAEDEGIFWAEYILTHPKIFQRLPPPEYADDPEAQYKLPRFSYHYWDPAYRKAFYSGFKKRFEDPETGPPRFRHLKLPLEPSGPFFTDPVADAVAEQFLILEGKMKESSYDEVIDDGSKYRESLIKAFLELADAIAPPKPGETKHSLEARIKENSPRYWQNKPRKPDPSIPQI